MMMATTSSTTAVRVPPWAVWESCAIFAGTGSSDRAVHKNVRARETKRVGRQKEPPAARPITLFLVRGCEESGFLHEIAVQGFVLRDPVRVLLAGHESLVEGAVFHEFLPLRRVTQPLE